LDKKQAGLATSEGKNESIFLFWVMALIPAICVAIAYLYWWLLLPYNLNILIKGVLVPAFISFVVNLAIPVARDRKKALLFAIPTFITHLFSYSFPLFWSGIMAYISPGDIQGGGAEIIRLGILLFLLEILILAMIAFCAWLGTRLKRNG
jgi:hypothetical protein